MPISLSTDLGVASVNENSTVCKLSMSYISEHYKRHAALQEWMEVHMHEVLTVRAAELGDGVDEAPVELRRPPQPLLRVPRQRRFCPGSTTAAVAPFKHLDRSVVASSSPDSGHGQD